MNTKKRICILLIVSNTKSQYISIRHAGGTIPRDERKSRDCHAPYRVSFSAYHSNIRVNQSTSLKMEIWSSRGKNTRYFLFTISAFAGFISFIWPSPSKTKSCTPKRFIRIYSKWKTNRESRLRVACVCVNRPKI